MNSLPALLPNGWNQYAGLVVMLAPMISGLFGYTPTPEFNGNFEQTILATAQALGALYAAYGKLRHDIPTWFKKA